MRRNMKRALLVALCGALSAGPALAREDFCLNRDGSRNNTATKGYRAIENNRNENLMRRIDGTWRSRTDNPFTGQISFLWQTFEGRGAQSGVYSYYNVVCDRNGQNCSRAYQGVGLWAVQGSRTNFNGMRIVSDLDLDHFCQLLSGRLSNNNDVWTTKTADGDFVQVRVPGPGQ